MRQIFLCLLFALCCMLIQAQAFKAEIAAFKKQDSISFPPANAILFIGSSSFTKWKDVQSYFPAKLIINRGFGGSSLPDVIRYADDIIFPYHPKQIVIYCGDNDLAASDTVSATVVFQRFKQLYYLIRSHMKSVPIVYISIKPSPSRRKLIPKARLANELIQGFLSKQQNAKFVDVYHSMLDKSGQPKPEIFTSDSLHMNAKGYELWKQILTPYLVTTKHPQTIK